MSRYRELITEKGERMKICKLLFLRSYCVLRALSIRGFDPSAVSLQAVYVASSTEPTADRERPLAKPVAQRPGSIHHCRRGQAPARPVRKNRRRRLHIYTIQRKCPVDFKPQRGPWEPLSHFMPKGIWGRPRRSTNFTGFSKTPFFSGSTTRRAMPLKSAFPADFNRLLRSPLLTNG